MIEKLLYVADRASGRSHTAPAWILPAGTAIQVRGESVGLVHTEDGDIAWEYTPDQVVTIAREMHEGEAREYARWVAAQRNKTAPKIRRGF